MAHIKKIMLIHSAVYGIEDMVNSLFVSECKGNYRIHAHLHRIDGRILIDNIIRLFHYHLFKKRGKIGKMIVKRIAVDTAILNDILDRDLVQRSFVQQFDK